MFANPQKRGFIGGVFAPEIHHVKPEVEVVGNMKIDFVSLPVFSSTVSVTYFS